MYYYLSKINKPEDLLNLSFEEIDLLSDEIRKFLIKNISKTGGHLASNLGVVELTLALHSIFDTNKDKIVFDVGHQSYVHKIITGRRDKFNTLRQFNGISGFPKRNESIHDSFDTGHSSTSISAALGMAIARDISKKDYQVVALIGDGALTGGMALEGLNHLGSSKTDLMVILNDNEMSICKNVGGISNYLCNIRITRTYRKLSKQMIGLMSSVPIIGTKATNVAVKIKDGLKHIVMPGAFFEEMGIKYFGPIDGHDYRALVKALSEIKKISGPKIVHVITKKGKGYDFAEKNPSSYHGVGSFEVNKGVQSSSTVSYSNIAGNTLMDIFEKDENCVAITAAMTNGTGLDDLKKKYPKRVIDVGIAEGHAVTFAAGMAASGVKPYFAVYSTFLQRAYDQIVHDVALQKLPVTLLVDRAGLVGEDGETHHGILDLGYLNTIPDIVVLAPKDKEELELMINETHYADYPVAIRYPRGKAISLGYSLNRDIFKWENLRKGKDVVIIAAGKMVETALNVSGKLIEHNISCEVVNARVIKPMDLNSLNSISLNHNVIYTLEDNTISGGLGSNISKVLMDIRYSGTVKNISLPDSFIEHGSVDLLYEKYGLSSDKIVERIINDLSKDKILEEIS